MRALALDLFHEPAPTGGVTFFASGSNHAGEVRALSMIDGAHCGVVADKVKGATGEGLATFPRSVFVDSGAFSEVEFPSGVPTIARPLTEKHWQMVFSVYRWTAERLGARAYLVAPDCVAHQQESIDRLSRYADEVREIASLGPTLLVPMQKGADSLSEYAAQVDAVLDGVEWTPSFPMMKDATSLGDIRKFIKARRPAALHFLGCAPDGPRGGAIRLAQRMSPACVVSADACLIKRWVGHSGGVDDGPRVITLLNMVHARKIRLTCQAHGIELPRNAEVRMRKCLTLFRAAQTYWVDNGLAEQSSRRLLTDVPDDLSSIDPVYADLVREIWLAGCRKAPIRHAG